MKKLKSTILFLSLFMSLAVILCFNSSAAKDSFYTYTVNNGEATITDVDTSISGDVIVPSTLGGCPVTKIGELAFGECAEITSITISDSVAAIGQKAFTLCKSLKAITLGENVTYIENSAFDIINPIERVYVKDIESWLKIEFESYDANPLHNGKAELYLNNELVTELVIPDGTTQINAYAFNGFNSIKSVTIPVTVKTIGENAFRSCSNLESVTINEGVEVIEKGAFSSSRNLKQVTIPDSVKTMGVKVFDGCKSLESIKIPEGITTISMGMFMECYSLKEIVIPDSVTSIENMVFFESALEKITLGSGVKSIGYGAFMNCDLKSITVPSNVTDIGVMAFGYFDDGDESHKERDFIIYGDKGFASEKYAIENGFQFKEIPHSYITKLTKATLSKNGNIKTTCSECNFVKTESIPKIKNVTLSVEKYTYNGKTKKPTVTVKDSKGKTLEKDTDYSVKYQSGRKLPGKYAVTVTFKGNYSGEKKIYFTIVPKTTSKITSKQTTTTVTLKWNKVTGADGYRVFQRVNGKWKTLTNTSKLTYTVKKLKAGTKYTFAVRPYVVVDGDKIFASTYTKIKTATRCKTPTLKVTSTKKGVASFSWTNVAGETGYQIWYSEKSDKSFKKISNYKANAVSVKKTGFKSGKKYYFKVRTYTKTDSGYVYSTWSSVKSVKIK